MDILSQLGKKLYLGQLEANSEVTYNIYAAK